MANQPGALDRPITLEKDYGPLWFIPREEFKQLYFPQALCTEGPRGCRYRRDCAAMLSPEHPTGFWLVRGDKGRCARAFGPHRTPVDVWRLRHSLLADLPELSKI